MTGEQVNEVMAILRRIGPVILGSATNASGAIGGAMRQAVGLMMADTNMTHMPTLAVALTVSLDLARQCNASLSSMDRVRRAALAESPTSLPATLTVLAIVRLALACEARILTGLTFKSRDEVDGIATSLTAAFNETEEVAADDLDAGTYQALIRLHGDVVKYLSERGRQLPRVIDYRNPGVEPVLTMAQRAYADPARTQELIDENRVVHPAFMPLTGKMLAV